MNKQIPINNPNVKVGLTLLFFPDTIVVECLEPINEELWSLEENPTFLLNVPPALKDVYQLYMSNELPSHTAPSIIYRHPEPCNDFTSALFLRLDYFLLLSCHNLSNVCLHLLPELERQLSQASYSPKSDPQRLINLFYQMIPHLFKSH